MPHPLSMHKVTGSIEDLLKQVRSEPGLSDHERKKFVMLLEGIQKTICAFCLSENGEYDEDFCPGPHVRE